MKRASIAGYVEEFLQLGDETAYAYKRGYRLVRWSYTQVAQAASQFGRELEQRGIAKGERVMLWGENCAEWAVVFFGCALRGVVVVPMDETGSLSFMESVAEQVEPRLLVASSSLIVERGVSRRDDIEVNGRMLPVMFLDSLPEDISAHSSAPHAGIKIQASDVIEIIFTSGATADPKGVVLTHGNILANLEPLEAQIEKYLKYERFFHPLRFLNLLPLSHVFGQFLGLFIPPLLGGTVLFQRALNPSEVIRTIARERVSVVVAVPRLLASLRDKIQRDFDDAGKGEWFTRQLKQAQGKHFVRRWWRFRHVHNQFGWKFWAFICGGAALDAETEEFWRRMSFVVIQGYGLTETTSLVSVNHPFKSQPGSIGKILPGREMKLDESGEILVRGKNIASGYWQQKQVVPISEEGWFRTGDLGAIDESGNLYFKGRKKDVIVTAEGLNIYPRDLEEVLRQQPEVKDCVVIGISSRGDTEPCAVVILRETGIDLEPVIRKANQHLAPYQHIRRWLAWPGGDFPRTSTQKPRAAVIREWAQSQLSSVPAPAAEVGAFAGLIARIKGSSNTGRIAPHLRLEDDLGLSSIDRVELMSAIEDRYQVKLDESQFSGATTIGEVEQAIRNPASEGEDYPYPRWAANWPWQRLRIAIYWLLVWPATMLLSRPRVRFVGKAEGETRLDKEVADDNIPPKKPGKGPFLIVSNHVTKADIAFIQTALPRALRNRLAVAMSGEMLREMRSPPTTWSFFHRRLEQLNYFLIAAFFNVFPLPQHSGFLESFAYAGELADRGYSIVVFPEGRRTDDGRLQPFQRGVGLLASGLGLPVLPLRIDGLFELKKARRHFSPPGTVQVRVGAPIRFRREQDPESIAKELEDVLSAL